MKSLIYFLLIMLMCCGAVTAAEPGLIEELTKVDTQIAALADTEMSEAILLEKNLIAREHELFSRLIADAGALEGFVQMSEQLVSGMPQRFLQRLRFEVNQENRTELVPVLKALQPVISVSDAGIQAVEPVNALIYGVEVDLKNGEWRQSPSSKRFWVSAEYPWLILSPVEYRHYLNADR